MPQVEELETALDLPLQLVYMKQLTLLREKALQRYKTLAKGSETSDYQVWTKIPNCHVAVQHSGPLPRLSGDCQR